MDSTILSELIIIRWLLIALVILFTIALLVFVIRNIFELKMRKGAISLQMRDYLIAQAQLHESQGEYIEFLETSEKLLELYPDDVNANWYYALSNYKTGHLGEALGTLARIKLLDPAWSKDTIDEYIDIIKSEMKGPKSV